MLSRVDQQRTPFLDGVLGYASRGLLPMHTPGHKLGNVVWPPFVSFLGQEVFSIDPSDVLESPENDHDWDRCLEEAQALAASLFGSDATFFCVNGTSGGIHAAMMGTCGLGRQVVMSRASHMSVYGGLILTGSHPYYVQSKWNPDFEVSLPVPAKVWQEGLARTQAPVAVVTNPNYYGLAGPLAQIVEAAHEHGTVVIVDEAHGPHLRFDRRLPADAMAVGADVAVQSTHKLLTSLTQSSMLHVRRGRVLPSVIRQALNTLQTTSSSPLLLASLDAARAHMAKDGEGAVGKAVDLALKARERIEKEVGLRCMETSDPTKITVQVGDLGVSGISAAAYLRKAQRVQVELATGKSILALVTVGDSQVTIDRFVMAMNHLARAARDGRLPRSKSATLDMPALPPIRVVPREAVLGRRRRVSLKEAIGSISSQFVAPYPPGIPVLVPGEEVTADVVDFIEGALDRGTTFKGTEGYTVEALSVLEA